MLGAERHIVIAREVTKMHEEFLRGAAAEVRAELASRPTVKGEITLLIGPADPSQNGARVNTSQSLADRVEELMHQAKLDRREALKLAAKERGITRRAAYDQLLESKQGPYRIN